MLLIMWFNINIVLYYTRVTLSKYQGFHVVIEQDKTSSNKSPNPRERMCVVQTLLLIVTFLSLISQNLLLPQTTKEVNLHPCIVPSVNMWSVTSLFLFFFFSCHLLNVGAHICHIVWEGQMEWTTPT